MDVFREALTGLLRRPDVQGVYAQIAEVDPGAGSWPFTDTVLVVGAIPVAELRVSSAHCSRMRSGPRRIWPSRHRWPSGTAPPSWPPGGIDLREPEPPRIA